MIIKISKTMKLYELLEKVTFEALEKYIGKSANYKCTYDILKHIEPEIDGGRILVTHAVSCNGNSYISIDGCDVIWGTDDWEKQLSYILGSDILIENNSIELFEDKLLAEILIELTFNGYTPKNYRDVCCNTALSNSYKKDYWNIIYKRNKRYLDKFYIKEIPELCFEFNLGYDCRLRKNRSKKKRYLRQTNRLKTLKRMGQVEDVVLMLLADSSSITREQLCWLFKTESLSQKSYQSYSYNKERRMSYLYELFTEYNARLFDKEYSALKNNKVRSKNQNSVADYVYKPYSRFVVTLNVSPDYPLTDKEKSVFEDILSFEKKENLIVGFGYDYKLGHEAEIIVISASNELENEPEYFDFESQITDCCSMF